MILVGTIVNAIGLTGEIPSVLVASIGINLLIGGRIDGVGDRHNTVATLSGSPAGNLCVGISCLVEGSGDGECDRLSGIVGVNHNECVVGELALAEGQFGGDVVDRVDGEVDLSGHRATFGIERTVVPGIDTCGIVSTIEYGAVLSHPAAIATDGDDGVDNLGRILRSESQHLDAGAIRSGEASLGQVNAQVERIGTVHHFSGDSGNLKRFVVIVEDGPGVRQTLGSNRSMIARSVDSQADTENLIVAVGSTDADNIVTALTQI